VEILKPKHQRVAGRGSGGNVERGGDSGNAGGVDRLLDYFVDFRCSFGAVGGVELLEENSRNCWGLDDLVSVGNQPKDNQLKFGSPLVDTLASVVAAAPLVDKMVRASVGSGSARKSIISDRISYIGTAFVRLHLDPRRAKEEFLGFAGMMGERGGGRDSRRSLL